jgi:hypothetical protein
LSKNDPVPDLSLEKLVLMFHISQPMKYIIPSLLAVFCVFLSACNKPAPVADQPSYQCIAAKITIADKQVDSVVQWNSKTGEARLLNAASFADKATGQQGNLIGWVPLVDLQQAVQNLASQIQAQQQRAAAQSATPSSTPIKPKKD